MGSRLLGSLVVVGFPLHLLIYGLMCLIWFWFAGFSEYSLICLGWELGLLVVARFADCGFV